MVTVKKIIEGSLADRHGIREGDVLLSINHNDISDVLDYRFYLTKRSVALRFLRGEDTYTVLLHKGEYEDIGLAFETPLMDQKHACKNGCIFCFIDQNPQGMRDSIYFKDDDSRLSFLHGNYITLTNMTDKDVERIVKMRFSPVNISVHTTNPDLRVKMMKNKRAGEVLRYLDTLKNAGIQMCGQIVLCRGVNDGEELLRSMRDLSLYFPALTSCAIVPAGLTAHRDGLYPLSDFSKEEAQKIISDVTAFSDEMLARCGSRVFFLADEFYLKAGADIPSAGYYEEYSQIENGVGMLRSFSDAFDLAFSDIEALAAAVKSPRAVSVVTGVASYEMIRSLTDRLMAAVPGLTVRVHKIINRFFGESITVSGLLTGRDIAEQMRDTNYESLIFVPENTQKADENVFLCGMSLDGLSRALDAEIRISPSDGYEFLYALLGLDPDVAY